MLSTALEASRRTLLAGVFASTSLGPFSGQGFAEGIESMLSQVGIQALGVASVFIYTGVLTWVILKVLEATMGLRVGVENEQVGLDIFEHEERGYDL